MFVDENLVPHPDQWGFLASVQPLPAGKVEPAIQSLTAGGHPLDVRFIEEEDEHAPWNGRARPPPLPAAARPSQITITVADRIDFERSQLTPPLANRLIRIAAFQNPEFYRAQVMRRPVWNEPRIIRPEPLASPVEAGIQEVFRCLAEDIARTEAIAQMVRQAYRDGRKVLVLTERASHVDALRAVLGADIESLLTLVGRMRRREREATLAALRVLLADAPRILLATGRLVGEGFDHSPLDTLVLAMPIAWRGTLQQYVGRLHREAATKTDIRVIDVVDGGNPALVRMWRKRAAGYRAMGYQIRDERTPELRANTTAPR
ncbi:MAG: hypothetical protein H6983_18015 [Ectothiorhodospiraceae bacterium]|nr:hypothetical protein [Ectothiorhodospiraceae bacterium]